MSQRNLRQTVLGSDLAVLLLLALSTLLLRILISGRYGFHRDELATLDDARHLAWGYVIYPPVTPFFGRIALWFFGFSLRGFRVFPAVAQALALLLTGLAARELGGKREAQITAALAVCITGHTMFIGLFLSYTSLDYPCWILLAYFVIRLLKFGDARWWIAIGAAAGLGLMTKYTMAFLLLGALGGTLLTPALRYLKTPWLWGGLAITLCIVMPHLFWQYQHQFVSLAYLKSIHARDVSWGRADGFLLAQLWRSVNPVTVPLVCAGLWYLFAHPEGKRYRLLGWMYVIPLLAFLAAKGRDYYLAPAYPMLFAAGAVWAEQWVQSLRPSYAVSIRQTIWISLAVGGLYAAALTLPLAPVGSRWWFVLDRTTGNFNYEIGWPDMVQTVADIRESLPANDQAALGVLARDDGEVGALNLYGPAHGLPIAISGMNSHWSRGYGNPAPQTLIVIGWNRDYLQNIFVSCQLAGHITNQYGIVNGSVDGYPDIFVCRSLRQSWPEFWSRFQYFG